MIAAREESHVLMDELDINWGITSSEVQTFRAMWAADMSIDSIAEELGRKKLEVGLLIIEQAELGEIQVRQQGIFGK